MKHPFLPGKLTFAVLATMAMLACSRLPLFTGPEEEPGPAAMLSSGQELFYSSYPHAFVSANTQEPVVINGANIKRAPHRASGQWQTPWINEEITAMGGSGAPALNAIRIAMDWPYYQPAADSIDESAFEQLDILIDNARDQGLYVILDPIHVKNPGSSCNEDPVMSGARWGIPAWAWQAAGAPSNPGGSCSGTTETSNLMVNVLALQATADYLKYVLTRYNASTERGRQVIAVDVVNEPRGPAAANAQLEFTPVLQVYADWLAPSGPKSLRVANPDKILIFQPIHGDISLAGMNLSVLQKPNVVFSFHDYFGRATNTSPVYGTGYSNGGWASGQEHTYQSSPTPYNPATLSYAARLAEHKTYVGQYLSWLESYQLPLYIGEYGILNPCEGGHSEYSARYAKDTYHIYDHLYVTVGGTAVPVKLARTWWTHGYWDGLSIWNRNDPCQGTANKAYFPYAWELTGELNLLQNPGFEDDFTGWTQTGGVVIANVTGNPANIRSGIKSAAAWSASPYTVTLENASAVNSQAGTYTATVWSRAGGSFSTRAFRVYVNGGLAGQMTLPVTTAWTAYRINNITVPAGATVKVEIALNASAGAWTQFDDFELRKN